MMNGAFMSKRVLIDREPAFDNNSVQIKRWMIRMLSVDAEERRQEFEIYSFVCDKKTYVTLSHIFSSLETLKKAKE